MKHAHVADPSDAPLCSAICTAPDPGFRLGSCHGRCIFTADEPHRHRCETHKQER